MHQIGVVEILPERPVLLQIDKHGPLLTAVVNEEFDAKYIDGVLRFHRR
jgi:hypothetical protein